MKLDDEVVEVREWDVVRVPPGTWRGYEGGPEGLEILVFGAPRLGENPRCRGLAHAARSGEQKRMGHAIGGDRVLEGLRNGFLPDQFVEVLAAVAPG